jgi:hypothetical protein
MTAITIIDETIDHQRKIETNDVKTKKMMMIGDAPDGDHV